LKSEKLFLFFIFLSPRPKHFQGAGLYLDRRAGEKDKKIKNEIKFLSGEM